MIGSIGARVLRIAVPHVELWNTWHAWYGNRPEGLAALQAKVDQACRDVGRPPGEVGRTAAVMIQLARGRGRRHGSPGRPTSEPLRGTPEELAAALRTLAAAGIGHCQIVLDPIDTAAVEEMGGVLALLDA